MEFAVSGPPGKPAEEGEKETGRVEAFSDGVFAMAFGRGVRCANDGRESSKRGRVRVASELSAAAIYAATCFAIAIAFNVLWRYASDGMRLIDPRADPEQVHAITRNYRFGPVFYFAAFLLAFVSVPASLGLCIALALFFGVTASREGVAEW